MQPTLNNAPTYSLNPIRWSAESLAVRAMYKVHGGDTAGAIADLKAVRRMARLIRQGHAIGDRIIAEAITEIVQNAEIE